jgi:hypothetical protein
MKKLIVLFAFVTIGFSINAQKSVPSGNFSKKEIENFKDKKFEWKEITEEGTQAVMKDGYYLLKGTRPELLPLPVKVESSAKLPFDPYNNFKITVNLQIIELTGQSAFQILLNSGNVAFAIAENGWAVANPNLACKGQIKTTKGSTVSLSVQKKGTTLFFSYNKKLLFTVEAQEIISSEVVLDLRNIVFSAEVNINEVIVEY